MASVKVKYRSSTAADSPGSIYYCIIHARKVRQLTTPYRIQTKEWDTHRSMPVVAGIPEHRRQSLLAVRENIRLDLCRLGKIIKKMEYDGADYSVDMVIDQYNELLSNHTLFRYMETQIHKQKENGHIRTSETYASALRSFRKYRDGKDVMLDAITPSMMEEYQSWHRRRGNCLNTISFYMRILRAVYNRAVDEDIIDDIRPFRHVYTGIGKTRKRALPFPILKHINDLDLSDRPRLEYARDMFMLSFCLRGMSFIDMAYLRKCDLREGHISYQRRKTGQRLSIAWTPRMQAILKKYPVNPTTYLLPIITTVGTDHRKLYRNVAYRINSSLKQIARIAGIEIPLTMYVARHSWATAARTKGIPLSLISEGMGHTNESTTRIYLSTLDTTEIDRANSLILSDL